MERLPMMSGIALTSNGLSGTPRMTSLPLGPRPPTACVEAVGVGQRGENHARAAELLQFGGKVVRGAVDVDVRAELLGERGLVFAARDGHGAIAGLGGELHGQVAEAADAEDGDQSRRAALRCGAGC